MFSQKIKVKIIHNTSKKKNPEHWWENATTRFSFFSFSLFPSFHLRNVTWGVKKNRTWRRSEGRGLPTAWSGRRLSFWTPASRGIPGISTWYVVGRPSVRDARLCWRQRSSAGCPSRASGAQGPARCSSCTRRPGPRRRTLRSSPLSLNATAPLPGTKARRVATEVNDAAKWRMSTPSQLSMKSTMSKQILKLESLTFIHTRTILLVVPTGLVQFEPRCPVISGQGGHTSAHNDGCL